MDTDQDLVSGGVRGSLENDPAPTEFEAPQSIVFGSGALAQVGRRARSLGAERVLVVTDAWMVEHGIASACADVLRAAGIGVAVFDGVQPDPTDVNVVDGLAHLTECRAEAVVAVGGGSVLDAAKMVAILATNGGPVRRYEGYHKIPGPGLPLIAIPTTAGTGSEVTKAAVISDTTRRVKMMILDRHLTPSVALVDAELSSTMPPGLTVHVGIDTLTHAIEAYVSRLANPFSDLYALSCIDLVTRFLERAYIDADDREAREGMALAATQGGLAFSNSSVALVHAMSRPIGAIFHVPHGLSNAVLLPAVTRYSVVGAPARYATVARTMGLAGAEADDSAACAALVTGVAELNARLGVRGLRDLDGVSIGALSDNLEKMAADAIASGSHARNPVVPNAEEIIALYRAAW